jgi:hypothetical protein
MGNDFVPRKELDMPGTPANDNRKAARSADNTKPGKTERVSAIERVGGHSPGSNSFSIPNHPEKCDVAKGPGGKMDR